MEALTSIGFQLHHGCAPQKVANVEDESETKAVNDGAALIEVNVVLNTSAVCLESRGWKITKHLIYDPDCDSMGRATNSWHNAAISQSVDTLADLIAMETTKDVIVIRIVITARRLARPWQGNLKQYQESAQKQLEGS